MRDPNIDDFITRWLESLTSADRASRTTQRYHGALRRFLGWFAQQERRQLTLADLTPMVLQGYRNALQKTEATSTVNVHVCALRAWCIWLQEAGMVDSNPARYLKMIKRTTPDAPRGLEDTQINALLRAAQRSRHPERDYALLQLLLQTGMRIGECASLTLRDITFGEKRGTVLIRAGKGNKARTVPLNGSARAALTAYVAPTLGVDPTLKAVAKAWPVRFAAAGQAWLWHSQMGKHLTESGIWRVITGLVRDCAVRGLVPADTTPHTLRHTFAQHYLYEHPGDLVGLARLLGHASLDTTSIYTQPTAEEMAVKVDQLALNAYEDAGSTTAHKRENRRDGGRIR